MHRSAIVQHCDVTEPPLLFQPPVVASKTPKTAEDVRRGARIKQLISESGMNQRAYGDKLGLSQNSMTALVKGGTVPSDETLRRICNVSRTTAAWVLDGTGERQLAPGVQPPKVTRSPRPGDRGHPDLVKWLSGTERGKSLNADARRFLRAIPWPEGEHVPETAFELALRAYQESHRSAR